MSICIRIYMQDRKVQWEKGRITTHERHNHLCSASKDQYESCSEHTPMAKILSQKFKNVVSEMLFDIKNVRRNVKLDHDAWGVDADNGGCCFDDRSKYIRPRIELAASTQCGDAKERRCE